MGSRRSGGGESHPCVTAKMRWERGCGEDAEGRLHFGLFEAFLLSGCRGLPDLRQTERRVWVSVGDGKD